MVIKSGALEEQFSSFGSSLRAEFEISELPQKYVVAVIAKLICWAFASEIDLNTFLVRCLGLVKTKLDICRTFWI